MARRFAIVSSVFFCRRLLWVSFHPAQYFIADAMHIVSDGKNPHNSPNNKITTNTQFIKFLNGILAQKQHLQLKLQSSAKSNDFGGARNDDHCQSQIHTLYSTQKGEANGSKLLLMRIIDKILPNPLEWARNMRGEWIYAPLSASV